ncbi:MAG TPA: Flp pilus assembly protein CpaB, partial [Candidatus Binataceae bacterium]
MSRQLTFFLFTAALALMAAFLVHSALKSKQAKIEALQENTVRIVVAARALTPGETVDNTALRLISWPRGEVPPGAFNDFQAVAGKVVKNSLSVDQPIVASALLEAEKTGGVLPLLIPPGLRAMSIAVDDITDMAGFILPHSRVDVLVSVAMGGPAGGAGTSGEVTKIVLQNVTVLAVAQTLEAGPDQPRQVKVVTLLVTPLQAERLAAASRLGTIALAMRNFADDKELATSGVSI